MRSICACECVCETSRFLDPQLNVYAACYECQWNAFSRPETEQATMMIVMMMRMVMMMVMVVVMVVVVMVMMMMMMMMMMMVVVMMMMILERDGA